MKDIERIKTICDNYFNIDISVKTRAREYADARKMYYKLSRDLLRKPVKKIASIVNVDHSTVIVGSQRLDELISIDKDIEENYLTLRDKCLNDGAIFNIHTTDIFIKNAIEIWNDRYDYSKVVYKDSNTKVIIICKKHGEFEQISSNHYKYGCGRCGREMNVRNNYLKEKCKREFISKANKNKFIILNSNKI